jgi:hypothetical protein
MVINMATTKSSQKMEPSFIHISAYWMEMLIGIINIIIGIWSFNYIGYLFTIEITLPMSIFIAVPSFLIGIYFTLHAIEKTNKFQFQIISSSSSSVSNNSVDSESPINSKIQISIGKIRPKTYEFDYGKLESLQFGNPVFSVAEGILLIFQSFCGLGFIYYSYELYHVSATIQGLPFLVSGLFLMLSSTLWTLWPARKLVLNFTDQIENHFEMAPMRQSSKILTELFSFFNISGEDSVYAKKLDIKLEKNGVFMIILSIFIFLSAYLTPIFKTQLIDTISWVILLLILRKLWLKSKHRVPLVTHWFNREISEINKIGQLSLYDIIAPPHEIRKDEWLFWAFILYESGWKLYHTVTLLIISPVMFTPLVILLVLCYISLICVFSLRVHLKSALNSENRTSPFSKKIKIFLLCILILPLSSILTAAGVMKYGLTILGIYPPI